MILHYYITQQVVPLAYGQPLVTGRAPAAAPTVLETGDHSPIGYHLSVTKARPLRGLTFKRSITSCHVVMLMLLPQLLDTPVPTRNSD